MRFTEDRDHRRIAVGLERGHEGVDRRFRRGEGFLGGGGRSERNGHHQRQRKPAQE